MSAPPTRHQAERPPRVEWSIDQVVERARSLIQPGQRRLLGIAGSPGAGKSTLAAALLEAVGEDAVLVPMDGFHLANQELERLGRRTRKGSPDTFDADGYAALLNRLRHQSTPVIYAPAYDRGLSISMGSALPIRQETPLVITEGNYLLMDRLGWEGVQPLLDEAWFLDLAPEVRSGRLVKRRQGFGHETDAAIAWVRDIDMPNGDIIEGTRDRADLVIRLLSAPDSR